MARTTLLIEKLSGWAFSVTLWAPALMAALITYDVVSRTLLGSPSLITDEITGYLLVFIAFMGAAEALRTGRHIGVDILTSKLPPRSRLRLKLVASSVSLLFLSVFWWHAVVMVYRSYVRNVTVPSSLLTPLWIPQVFIPIGMTLLILQMVAEIATSSKKLLSGAVPNVDAKSAEGMGHGT